MKRPFRFVFIVLGVLGALLVACTEGADPLVTEREEPSATGIIARIEPPESGIGVIAVRNGVATATTLTDESGLYRLVDLVPGEYSLIASGLGYFTDTSVRNLVVERGKTSEAPLITMRPLTAAVTFRGIVVDASTRKPLDGAEITIRCTSGICSNLMTETDAEGRYETSVWPDLAAELMFQKDGYRATSYQVEEQPSGSLFVLPMIDLERTRQ